jgi:ribonuclease D
MLPNFELIATPDALARFAQTHQGIEWLCFDTEFVGEKRFTTRLCLIQVASVHGFFLIDPFPLKDLDPFLALLQDPAIIKITHAGENDYRLLYNIYGIVPSNTFDTQIAAGFLGQRYPLAFKKLVETELGIMLSKTFTVADWEARPFNKNQLGYALEDIEPLYDLWQKQSKKLQKIKRLHWVEEECRQLESEDYYAKDPHHEALNSDLMKSLNQREKVFVIRLYEWRRKLAEQKNQSKEMVFPAKNIGPIAKAMRAGKAGLRDNRRIPERYSRDMWDLFNDMYQREISEEERKLLLQIPREEEESAHEEVMSEFMYLVIRHRCMKEDVAYSLALPRNWFKKIKNDSAFAEEVFGLGWRKEFFGDTFTEWFKNMDQIRITVKEDAIEFRRRG